MAKHLSDRKKQKLLQEKQKRRTEALVDTSDKYKKDKWSPVWYATELGIYETFVNSDGKLVDSTVEAAIARLVLQMKAGKLPPLQNPDEPREEPATLDVLLIENIRRQWDQRLPGDSRPATRDLIGVLRSILGSIDVWKSDGPGSQGYLRYLTGFLKNRSAYP